MDTLVPTMQLAVITPDRVVLETGAESLQVQLHDGWWGILPGHAPFIAHILSGILRYTRQGVTRYVALYQGTIEVQKRPGEPDRVLVLTAAAEEGDDIDTAQKDLQQQATELVRIAQEAKLELTQARAALEHTLRDVTVIEEGT